MDKKLHFITGLPRSGSTLLISILNQNPKFHASITDPLVSMVKGVLETSQSGPGIKTQVPKSRRVTTIHGLVDGYYKDIHQPVVFNTNRAWTLLTPQIAELFPESKIIICVRDIAWVLDSWEKAFRSQPLDVSSWSPNLGGSVYARCKELMSSDGMVGFAYEGIKQAITGNEHHKIMLMEYDLLCQQPHMMIEALYNFIDEPQYQHDFNDVEAQWDEYDKEIGIPIHRVRKKVEFIQRKPILPPDIFAAFENLEVWRT